MGYSSACETDERGNPKGAKGRVSYRDRLAHTRLTTATAQSQGAPQLVRVCLSAWVCLDRGTVCCVCISGSQSLQVRSGRSRAVQQSCNNPSTDQGAVAITPQKLHTRSHLIRPRHGYLTQHPPAHLLRAQHPSQGAQRTAHITAHNTSRRKLLHITANGLVEVEPGYGGRGGCRVAAGGRV